jgi:hypothetical protein
MAEGSRRQAALMTHKDLEDLVDHICRQLGLLCLQIPEPWRCGVRGWPDRVIVGPRGILFRELKTMSDVLSVDQVRVGERITAAGGDWAVWTPADATCGLIGRTLHELA